MDQVISANFSPSPIIQFQPFEPGTHTELESLLDDHKKIEIKKFQMSKYHMTEVETGRSKIFS